MVTSPDGTEALAVFCCGGGGGECHARGDETACVSAGIEPADSGPGGRVGIRAVGTERQGRATDGGGANIFGRSKGGIEADGRGCPGGEGRSKWQRNGIARWVCHIADRKDIATHLARVSDRDAEGAGEIARF